MKTSSRTHKGWVRPRNEDRYLVEEFGNGAVLLCLADGMGGHAAGDVAAQMTLEVMGTLEPDSEDMGAQMARLVEAAHARVFMASSGSASHRGMGTTLTAALVRSGVVHWVHVGDSRLYVLRGTELVQVTDDHTVPGLLLKRGEITRAMMNGHPLRNMLLRCVGCEAFEPDRGHFEARAGDLLLLSSDGLHDAVEEEIILSILSGEADLEGKLDGLVRAALDTGGRDNITVVAAVL